MKSKLLKVMVVFGTRPEAIKMAPLVKVLTETPDFQVKTLVTAQHREMLDQVLNVFDVTPEYDLNIMAQGQSLTDVTCRVLQGLAPILKDESPDLLLVHGDTTTTFASSLAAFYQGVKVGHVEAGLRTGDKQQPFPEEINRLLTARLADLHFAPTIQASENLTHEGIDPVTIYVTGNTVIDALQQCVAKLPTTSVKDEGIIEILVTAHRRENWGVPMANIAKALKKIIKAYSQVRLTIPMHLNPSVRAHFYAALGNEPQARLVEPFDYLEMAAALLKADLVLTDSGGLQEEAPALGRPVLVLREKTERPEAVTAGTVKLVGTDPELIFETVQQLLFDQTEYFKMAHAINPYGDGQATTRIVAAIKHAFGLKMERPLDFTPNEKN